MFSNQNTLKTILLGLLLTPSGAFSQSPPTPSQPIPDLSYVVALMSFEKDAPLPPGPSTPWDQILRRFLPLTGEGFFRGIIVNGDNSQDLPPAPIEKNLITVDETPLPDCLKPEVRLREVFYDTPGSETLDVIFFNPDDAEQRKKANQSKGNVVPYQAVLFLDRNEPEVDDWQLFARRAEIRCLPTHFRFRYVGSKRYMEHREGERAFDEKR